MTIQKDEKPAGLAQKIVAHFEVTDRVTGRTAICYTRHAAERLAASCDLSGGERGVVITAVYS